MLELSEQRIEKSIRDNGGTPFGIIEGQERVMIFRYRGLDMAMYVDEIKYQTVKEHIERKTTGYNFPVCNCGQEMPANMRGMTCSKCLLTNGRP